MAGVCWVLSSGRFLTWEERTQSVFTPNTPTASHTASPHPSASFPDDFPVKCLVAPSSKGFLMRRPRDLEKGPPSGSWCLYFPALFPTPACSDILNLLLCASPALATRAVTPRTLLALIRLPLPWLGSYSRANRSFENMLEGCKRRI